MERTCYLFSTGRRHCCQVVERGDGWIRVDIEDRGIHVIAPIQLTEETQ